MSSLSLWYYFFIFLVNSEFSKKEKLRLETRTLPLNKLNFGAKRHYVQYFYSFNIGLFFYICVRVCVSVCLSTYRPMRAKRAVRARSAIPYRWIWAWGCPQGSLRSHRCKQFDLDPISSLINSAMTLTHTHFWFLSLLSSIEAFVFEYNFIKQYKKKQIITEFVEHF